MINEAQARKYCCEDISLIENYELAIADKTQIWDCHHRAEILPCGIFSAEQLDMYNLYENVPASHLIFLTKSAHRRLHNKNLSEKTHIKLSAANTGENNPMFGKHHSEETRAKIMAAMSSPEMRAKISAAVSAALNMPETRAKMSAIRSANNFGSHWWTNGIKNKFCKECPGEGWTRGRLSFK